MLLISSVRRSTFQKILGPRSWLVRQRRKIAKASTASRIPINGLDTANQKETRQPDPRAIAFVFMLFSQAFEDRHFTEREFLSGYFDRSRSDQEGMPISRFVMRHVRVIHGGLFLGVAG